MFKLNPNERMTIERIKRSSWFNGPLPEPDMLGKIMETKVTKMWRAMGKPELLDVLTQIRSEAGVRAARHLPTPSPGLPVPSPLASTPGGEIATGSFDPLVDADTNMSLLSVSEPPVYLPASNSKKDEGAGGNGALPVANRSSSRGNNNSNSKRRLQQNQVEAGVGRQELETKKQAVDHPSCGGGMDCEDEQDMAKKVRGEAMVVEEGEGGAGEGGGGANSMKLVRFTHFTSTLSKVEIARCLEHALRELGFGFRREDSDSPTATLRLSVRGEFEGGTLTGVVSVTPSDDGRCLVDFVKSNGNGFSRFYEILTERGRRQNHEL